MMQLPEPRLARSVSEYKGSRTETSALTLGVGQVPQGGVLVANEPAQDTQPEARPEVLQRVTKERDEARSQLAEASKALEDVQLLNRAYEHFRSTEIPNAYDVANVAKDAIRGVEADKVGEALSQWYERQSALFNVPRPPEASVEDAEPASPAPPPSPFAAPNPVAPGVGGQQPVVMGSDAWKQWRQGRTTREVNRAIETGQVVVPESIKKAHDTFA